MPLRLDTLGALLVVVLAGTAALSAAERVPSFSQEVQPVLSKAGCNMGACHGNLNGKGGFKLSLRGEDDAFDYAALVREFNGRRYVMEHALKGDVALVEAWEGDRWGNLTYRASGRNFNPVMAMAADLTIAQVSHIRELGELVPENVHTPGIFVNRVIHVDRGPAWA